MRTLIVSDIHLGSGLCRSEEIINLLDEVKSEGKMVSGVGRLILNGDVFDNHDFRRLCKKQWKILSMIRKLSDDMEVIWVVGNHDGPLDIISSLLGVRVEKEYLLHSNGMKFLVHHGDIHDQFIMKYPWLTTVVDWFYHAVQKISHRFARILKRNSKVYSRNIKLVRNRAIALARKKKFDGAICGHTHFAEVCVVNGIIYANSGSWTEMPSSYLIVDKGEVTLHYFEPAAL